jgi:ribose-phosphate pyrophosphokinase
LGIPDLVVVSPDVGFAKNARKFASYLDLPTVICDKNRSDHFSKPEVIEIYGNVKNKNVLIVDDFTVTCGTLTQAAKAMKLKGAKSIYAVVTHALLDEKGTRMLEESPIDTLIITDTVFNHAVINNNKIKIISVAPLIAEAVKIIYNMGSLSSLFDHLPKRIIQSSF